jgi:hypothetical protein
VGVDDGVDVVMVIVAELELLLPTVPAALTAGLATSKQPIITRDEYFIGTLKRVRCKKTHDRGKISL